MHVGVACNGVVRPGSMKEVELEFWDSSFLRWYREGTDLPRRRTGSCKR